MEKTNFARKVIHNRMNDQQYIEHLEASVEEMNEKLNSFIEKMDKAAFNKNVDTAQEVFKTYAQEVQTLRM